MWRRRARHWMRCPIGGSFALLGLGSVLLAGLIAVLGAAPVVLADGGAPNLAYIAGGGASGNDLIVIDINKRQVTGTITVGGGPRGVVLTPDSHTAYVTESRADRVAIVDARSQQVTATVPVPNGPTALALDVSRSLIYVTEQGRDAVAFIDPNARKVVATIRVGQHPGGIAIAGPGSGISDSNETEIYVANSGSDSVTVISGTHRRVDATIPVQGGPLGVVIPTTGTVAYVSTRTGTVVAISLADHTVIGTLLRAPGSQLGAMDYDAVTGQIYVPDAANGAVYVLAPVPSVSDTGAPSAFPPEPVRTLHLAGGPAGVAITFDGAYGFIAERAASSVLMIDPSTRQTLATIPVGGTPSAIITGAYPPLVSSQWAFIPDLLVILLIGGGIYTIISLRRLERAQKKAKRRGGNV
jgi:YVTN family beta-propeller protein